VRRRQHKGISIVDMELTVTPKAAIFDAIVFE
jgi:hypothetical protein